MRTIALAVLFGSLASVAGARDDDPTRARLDKAKADYLAAVEKVKELANKTFADLEAKARAKADAKAVKQLEEARAAFDAWLDLPPEKPFDAARSALVKAQRDVIEAHKAAIRAYDAAKPKNPAAAAAVLKELNQLREGWDALQVGSVWTGQHRRVVPGKAAEVAAARVTVTDREGAEVTLKGEFEADGKPVRNTMRVTVESGRLTGTTGKMATVTGRVSAEHLSLTTQRQSGDGKGADRNTNIYDLRLRKKR